MRIAGIYFESMDRNINKPSSEPRTSSEALSGCGIRLFKKEIRESGDPELDDRVIRKSGSGSSLL